MFGNINEMYQALSEMNNHSLLTKADHPSGALLSVVQHLLQVELYQVCVIEIQARVLLKLNYILSKLNT